MREVAPAREWTLFHDLESRQTKHPAPAVFRLKRAWSSAPTPLSIVRPADHAIPPDHRYVFVNNRETTLTQHAAYFIQHEPWILRVMQHVAKQHGVEALIFYGKVEAVVRQVINARRGVAADVKSDYRSSEQTL